VRLQGKIAFVTGAGGGIGSSICERFLAEGARVAAADIDVEKAAAAVGSAAGQGRSIALACDAGNSHSLQEAISQAVAAFGGLNVLCSVAGGSTPQDGPVTDAPEAEFWRAIRLDLFGTFLCCKYGLPELIKAGGGSVINMSSMCALMGVPGRDCYTAAKGGVLSMTRSMAVQYAAHAIRVNAIAPGITRTPRVQAWLDTAGGTTNPLAARHLLGLAEPIDVAHLAVYLASDESRVVTGQVFPVDSGVTID
jgi:NAD(P)-dependent dehydrogenase (short-subunit alcohol dehydrogenase family)